MSTGWGGSVAKWLPRQCKALDSNPYRRGLGTHSFMAECPDTPLGVNRSLQVTIGKPGSVTHVWNPRPGKFEANSRPLWATM